LASDNMISAMRRRVPWQVGQKILAENGLPRSMGWERTVESVTQNALSAEQEALAANAMKEHILCGEKLVQFFGLSQDEIASLRSAVLALPIPDSDFQQAYPSLLTEADLRKAPSTPTLVARENGEDGVGLVFASVRVVTVREELNVDELGDEAADALSDFDEVVGVRNIRLQALDVVWIPHEGASVDTRTDYSKGMHSDVAYVAADRLREAFNVAVGYEALVMPENLFPLINRMYRDKDEGHVVELGFGTTTKSLKDEKMRGRNSDLRKEPYHVGGKGNLQTEIEPFRISVAWDRSIGPKRTSTPELSIHGNSRIGLSDNPIITAAIVRRCMGLADFEHVRSRINKHLAATAD
jgi:hypothetical protein